MSPKDNNQRTVLVVDDDPNLRLMMALGLAKAGFEVIKAENGAEAIRQLYAATVDLIVTDIVMPDVEGLELIQKLRESRSELRILAISGGGVIYSKDYLRAASLLGADRVLAKPFTTEAFISAVKEVLGQGKSPSI